MDDSSSLFLDHKLSLAIFAFLVNNRTLFCRDCDFLLLYMREEQSALGLNDVERAS